MAYKGILERQPGLAERLGQGLSSSIEKGLSIAQQLAGERRKQEAAHQKLVSQSSTFVPKYIKNHDPKYGSPEDLKNIEEIHSDILRNNPGMSHDEAIKESIGTYENFLSESGQRPRGKSRFEAFHNPFADREGKKKANREYMAEHPAGWLGDYLKPRIDIAKEKPQQLYKEAPVAGLMSLEGLNKLFNPGIPAAQSLIGGGRKQVEASDLLGQYMREGLTPEQAEKSKQLAETESIIFDLLGPSAAAKFAKKIKGINPAAQTMAESINPQILEKIKSAKFASETVPLEKAAADLPQAKSLSQKVTARPETGTELRVNRSEAAKTPSPIKEIVETRQKQLKAHPRYSEEITKDALERETRRAALIPKTAKGERSLIERVKIAESKLPKIEEAYHKASSRVRAIENQMAKHTGEELNRSKELYNVAKQELKEAAVDLENGLANARYGTSKVAVEESKIASRSKLDEIRDTIEKGKEYKLSGRDYSPTMIHEAKVISKKKPLPNLRQDDFYNKIHERYLQPYRQRADQLVGELKEARAAGDWKAYENLSKEKDIVGKMIQSAEAEQVRHTHKLALRDIAEAKRAKDRFAQLKPMEGKPKVSEVANEKMWRNQIKEAKTPEARAKVIKEGVADAATKHPEQAAKITAEGEKLANDFESMAQNPFHNLKDGIKKMHEFAVKYPLLAKYGSDFLIGVGTGIVDDVLKESGVEAEFRGLGGIVAATHSVFKIGKTRTGVKAVGHILTRWLLSKWHVNRAINQMQSTDFNERRKFTEQSPSRKKKAYEKSRNR